MPSSAKRRKLTRHLVEQVTFDPAARAEYLTGFHKRKQARIKHAQEIAEKRAKEEKIRQRREDRQMRAQRQREIDEQIEAVNREWRAINGAESEQGSEADDPPQSGFTTDVWEGFQEEPPPVSKIDEYIDEDKYATVTVEAVDISKVGFVVHNSKKQKGHVESDGTGEQNNNAKSSAREGVQGRKSSRSNPATRTDRPKKKKKKFKYESRDERRASRLKERSKNHSQAKARRAKAARG